MTRGVVVVRRFKQAKKGSILRRAHELGLEGVKVRIEPSGRAVRITAVSRDIPVSTNGQPMRLFETTIVKAGEEFHVGSVRCIVEPFVARQKHQHRRKRRKGGTHVR